MAKGNGKKGDDKKPPPEKKMFKCNKCGWEGERLSDLESHDYAAHGGQPPS